MKKLIMSIATIAMIPFAASAQYDEMTPFQIQSIIDKEILTEQVKSVSAPMKQHMDYVVNNYQEADLKKIIINMEENERAISKYLGEEYKPYDRKIDIKNKAQVERFLRNRVNAIY